MKLLFLICTNQQYIHFQYYKFLRCLFSGLTFWGMLIVYCTLRVVPAHKLNFIHMVNQQLGSFNAKSFFLKNPLIFLGYLFLASEEGVEVMQENHRVQMWAFNSIWNIKHEISALFSTNSGCGAKVELLSARRLKEKFPWLNTDGIELGSYGYENEGWFDPWLALKSNYLILFIKKWSEITNISGHY